jgi:hypothetical protein
MRFPDVVPLRIRWRLGVGGAAVTVSAAVLAGLVVMQLQLRAGRQRVASHKVANHALS